MCFTIFFHSSRLLVFAAKYNFISLTLCNGILGEKSLRKRKSHRKNKSLKKNRKSKKVNSIRSDIRRKSQKGGSDWRMSQYSRGPVNQPSQNPDEFRMFTQTADFIPNEALLKPKIQ